MKYVFSFVFVNLISFPLFSSHLSGGTITYKYVSGNSYHIILTAYYDKNLCAIPQAVNPPFSHVVEAYFGNGNYITSYTLTQKSITIIPPYQGSCVSYDSCYQLKKVIYSDTINLPTGSGGYHLYSENCCRYGMIQNTPNPSTEGIGFYAFIPDQAVFGNNNSPEWKKDPPTFYCINTEVNFNNSAWDIDGDSLIYSFYNPFNDIDYSTYGDLTFLNGIPQFENLNFVPPFHYENVVNMNGTDSLIVDQYGHVHGIPDNLGYFAAGIKCEEYRNGILMSTIYRDLRYVVINCPQMPLADFIFNVDCSGGGNVQFLNTGAGDSFYWDFDTSIIFNDTSTLNSPSYNYIASQCYDASLTATNNNGCISEEIIPVCVGLTQANFTLPLSACDSLISQLINQSTFPAGSSIQSVWYTSTGDSSHTNHFDINLFASDTHSVTLIINNTNNGCTDTLTQFINVYFCNGIFELNYEKILVYPNPCRDYIYFYTENHSFEITIVNNSGENVLNKINTNESVSISHLTPGIYFFKIIGESGKIYTGKFYKE